MSRSRLFVLRPGARALIGMLIITPLQFPYYLHSASPPLADFGAAEDFESNSTGSPFGNLFVTR
jgi:hypothetical protein